MEDQAVLHELTSKMHLEPGEEIGAINCSSYRPQGLKQSQPDPYFAYAAVLPNGKRISLLKTLLTSACEMNCNYCPFRAGRDFRRATLSPDAMARIFMDLHRSGIVEGLFLSSAIAGGSIRTQDRLLDTVEILRGKKEFTGYVHLKLMPGAERDQVLRAMQLADRVSLNLEAPNTERLALLAPKKRFLDELLQPLRWVQEIRATLPGYRGWKGHWPSMATQFVVGAVGESDLELLSTTSYLYSQLSLSRAYFSNFNPNVDTPLEHVPASPPVRELRLYQASFLLRDYGFDLEDLPFSAETGNLPVGTDPKTAWAQLNLRNKPVEINHADRHELLRIPGIGPKSADAILRARRRNALRYPEDLYNIGVNPAKSLPYILLSGTSPQRQLSFF